MMEGASMKARVVLLAIPVLALAWMLLITETSFAQRRLFRGQRNTPDVAPAGVIPAGYDSFYPQGLTGQAAMANAALIRVTVPPDARVFFDDTPTQQTGPQRVFM